MCSLFFLFYIMFSNKLDIYKKYTFFQNYKSSSVGGINIGITRYYLLGAAIFSQVKIGQYKLKLHIEEIILFLLQFIIFIHLIAHPNKLKIIGKQKKFPIIIHVLTMLFPIHFIYLENLSIKIALSRKQRELKQ